MKKTQPCPSVTASDIAAEILRRGGTPRRRDLDLTLDPPEPETNPLGDPFGRGPRGPGESGPPGCRVFDDPLGGPKEDMTEAEESLDDLLGDPVREGGSRRSYAQLPFFQRNS